MACRGWVENKRDMLLSCSWFYYGLLYTKEGGVPSGIAILPFLCSNLRHRARPLARHPYVPCITQNDRQNNNIYNKFDIHIFRPKMHALQLERFNFKIKGLNRAFLEIKGLSAVSNGHRAAIAPGFERRVVAKSAKTLSCTFRYTFLIFEFGI